MHVFTYSERVNTPAAEFKGTVNIAERKKRNKMLRVLSAKKLRAFYELHKGKNEVVIFEHENKNGFMYGFTSNYIKVKAPFNENLCNLTTNVKLNDFDEEGIMLVEII